MSLSLLVFYTAVLSAPSLGFLIDTVQQITHRQICYTGLGCFATDPPFTSLQRPLSVLPDSPDTIQTTFLLYTRSNPTTANEQILSAGNLTSIATSYFNSHKQTKFIVHGFTHNGHRQWIRNMVAQLLIKDDYNVIVVDWGHGAGLPYTQATANTRVVGAQIAQLITVLQQSFNASMGDMHIIGHSLGAHISGYAGERLQHLGRITGMDPADPYFQGTDVKVRLDPGDADFVDIIHTDGSSILALGLGASQAMGHVDFFPNGGKDQPGCDAGLLAKVGHTVWNAVSKLDYYAAEGAVACSHERSYELFTESINSACPFRAYPCTSSDEFHNGKCLRCHQDDCSEMGLNANKYSARGSLYLETEAASNYCDFHYQLNVSGSNNFDGRLIITLHGSKTNAGPIQLMKDIEVHNQGTNISKMFKTNIDVGEVIGITLDYEKTANLVVGWAFPDNWTLNGIAVWSATDQKLYRFCAYNKVAANHVKTTFGVSEHCA